jgi:hypothetical protein
MLADARKSGLPVEFVGSLCPAGPHVEAPPPIPPRLRVISAQPVAPR